MLKKLLAMTSLCVLFACTDSPMDPVVPQPEKAIVHNGTPYPQVDAQLSRFYAFSNCLTGLWQSYMPNPQCPVVDMTYEIGTIANEQLANVFPQGFVVNATTSRTWLANYLNTIEQAYAIGRVTCRGRYAARKIGSAIDTVLIDIIAGRPIDLSKLPQPLGADIMDTSPFAGANDAGTACNDSPLPPVAAAGGYSIFVSNTSCNDAGRSVEIARNRAAITQTVHSNASVRIAGTGNWINGNTTHRCAQTVAAGNDLASGPTLSLPIRTAPFAYTAANFPCTYSRTGNFNLNFNGPWWVGGTSASRKLQPGTYCATGDIILSVPLVTGNVTFSADGRISITSIAPTLRAFANGVVLYSRSPLASAISLSGAAHSYSGHLYAPLGRINVMSQNAGINGTLVANRVLLNANDIVIYGVGAPI